MRVRFPVVVHISRTRTGWICLPQITWEFGSWLYRFVHYAFSRWFCISRRWNPMAEKCRWNPRDEVCIHEFNWEINFEKSYKCWIVRVVQRNSVCSFAVVAWSKYWEIKMKTNSFLYRANWMANYMKIVVCYCFKVYRALIKTCNYQTAMSIIWIRGEPWKNWSIWVWWRALVCRILIANKWIGWWMNHELSQFPIKLSVHMWLIKNC